MKQIARLTQNFLDMLESKINAGNTTLVGKILEVKMNHAECERDVKLILLEYMKDDRVKDKLRDIVKKKYPHLMDTLDKLLILV